MSDFTPKIYDGPLEPVAIIEHYATQAGDNASGWGWWGPSFKPENQYMTEDGYILGTTIWYVRLEMRGRYWCVYGDTFTEAALNAQAVIKEIAPLTNITKEQRFEILKRLGKSRAAFATN